MTAITAVTVQNTKGVQSVFPINANEIYKQIAHTVKDIMPDAVKIGMLHSTEVINNVYKSLKKIKTKKIILDPVMVAKGGHPLLENKAINLLKKNLMAKSLLITPNLLEAEKILNYKIKDLDSMIECSKKFLSLGFSNVLLKGGHLLKSEKVTDLLFCEGKVFKFYSKRINTNNTHGTGCSLASAITANLFLGKNLRESVKISRKFVNTAIRSSYEIGHGHNPINHFVNFKS